MHPDHKKRLEAAQHKASLKDLQGAVEGYAAFLALEPKHPGVWADYAGQLVQLGRSEDAIDACHTALGLDPLCLSARNNLGCILMWREQLEEAEQQFRTVLTADRKRLDARLNLAECLLKKNDLPGTREALDGADSAALVDPAHAHLVIRHATQWANLGTALLGLHELNSAEDACSRAIHLEPTNFVAKVNLGAILMARGALDDAEACFRRLISQFPDRVPARLLLVDCLARKGAYSLCDQEISEVRALAPRDFQAHTSITATCFSHGRWDSFRAEVARYRTLNVQTHSGLDPQTYLDFEEGFMDLLFGDMEKGWRRYEARLLLPREIRPKRTFAQPSWTGASFHGKTLLVWAEQGLGDTLMFLRYLPIVRALGGRVILEVQPALRALITANRVADLVIPRGAPLPRFDLQASLLSLPWIFRTVPSSIPSEVPYLVIPPSSAPSTGLADCLTRSTGEKHIGLVWAGNQGHVRDHERSLLPEALAPLAAIPHVKWFSFQLGHAALPPLPNIISLAPYLKDFADTGHALQGMDLLITVDTSVAHLAGALGIPTFLLVSYQPDFRWLLDREDSPWYPSLRLYRQPAYGDWESVIRRVAVDLIQEA